MSGRQPGKREGKRGADNDEDEARKRQRQAAVRSRIQDLDTPGALGLLDDLSRRWQLDLPQASFEQVVTRAFENFGASLGNDLSLDQLGSFGLRQLDDRIHEHEMEAIALYHKLRELKLLGDDQDRLTSMVKILELIFHAKRTILSVFQAKLAMHQVHCPDLALDDDLDKLLASWQLRFRWMQSETKPNQDLLLYLLDCAMEKRYRRFNGYCYEPIVVNSYNTHAWRQVCSVQDFVYAMINKETNWQQWINATTNAKNIAASVEYLTSCRDYQFPALVKQRGVYAFRNGVYVASEDAMHCFGADSLPDSVVACKFFDAELSVDPDARWDQIPTPHLQSVLDYQEFPDEVCRWLYVLLGRLLYPLGQLDAWQVIPFFKGQASSGKSTICLKVAKNFFDAIDVGVLSNNIEKKFGLSAFHDKYLFVAPEIKNDLAIEQAEFQSVVSGEDIQVNVKHKKAFSTQWTVPGVLAGNETPAWCDNAGSIQRRIVLFDFKRAVTNGDMKLGEKLDAELPMILVKCNRAYLEAVRDHGSKNIWTVLPAYFRNTRDVMAQDVNAVEAFLASPEVMLHPEAYCPFDEFKHALKAFEQQNGYKSSKYTWDYFRGPFAKYSLAKVREAREYRGRRLTREYVCGVDLGVHQESQGLG